jgi:hypothetical protein
MYYTLVIINKEYVIFRLSIFFVVEFYNSLIIN